MRLRFFSFWVLAAVAAISLFSREASAISGIYLAQRWSVPEPGPFVTVMARNGNRTVITLLPGASGGGSVFTLLIPVSGSLSLEGVGSASPDLIQSLDNFTAPRLLYRDDTNPCQPDYSPGLSFDSFYWRFCPNHQTQPTFALAALKNHGVSGVYDFKILDPKDPTGTLEWLARKNYILPHGFAGALEEFSRTGAKLLAATFTLGISSMPEKGSLPPIVMELDEPAMTLPPPFPLAKPSDLVVFVLSGQGMPIIENYEARRLPNDGAIPMAALNRHFDRYTASLMDPSSQYGKGKVSLEFHSAIGPVECRDYFHFESALAGYGIRQKKPSGLEELAITRFRLHHSWRLFPESIVFKPEFSKGGRILPFTWVRKPFAGDTACAGGEGYLENYESWTKESANMITDQYLDPDWRETLAKEVETISLFNSAAKGDIAQLEKAVAAGMNINMTGAMGATFLSSAANHGAKNSALWLLQKGANVEPPWICNGNCPMPYTPLTLASERGDLEMMSILLAYGADIEAKAIGHTPLMSAAKAGQLDAIRLLIYRGAKVNARTNQGKSALRYAMAPENRKNWFSTVKALIEAGIVVDLRAGRDSGALHQAIYEGDTKVTRLILENATGFDIAGEQGRQALFTAIEAEQVEMVRLFLDMGADIDSSDDTGNTPFIIATAAGDIEIMDLLYTRGADIAARNKEGLSARYFTTEKVFNRLFEGGAGASSILDLPENTNSYRRTPGGKEGLGGSP